MRLHRLAAEAVALAVQDSSDECRDTGVDVDDGAAGEVEGLDADLAVLLGKAAQPAADAPDPVRHRVVDQGGQRTMNTRKVLNLARSAKAPVIRAGVITANMSWKIMKVWCGIVAA